ncbi:gag-Pol polyprotein/retrotransposon [Carex rostrata]
MSSAPLRLADHRVPLSALRPRNGVSRGTLSLSPYFYRIQRNNLVLFIRRCSHEYQPEVDSIPVGDVKDVPLTSVGPENSGVNERGKFSSNELLHKLKRYGVAGILSYGLLNTVYYLTTFLLVWFYFAPAPSKLGYAAAVKRFVKVMAMVWAGSQVTKIIRAGGALALAPFVDKGLSWFTVRFKFESEGKASVVIAGFCFALALLLFFGLTLLWA